MPGVVCVVLDVCDELEGVGVESGLCGVSSDGDGVGNLVEGGGGHGRTRQRVAIT